MDGLRKEGWLGQGTPGRVWTPTLAWGLGAPGMEILTLALRTALESGFPSLNRGGDCSPGRLERGVSPGWAAQEGGFFLFRL